MKNSDCPFCSKTVIETGGFAETTLSYVLYNHKPIVQGHVLVIPKRHVSHYDELTSEEILDLGRVIQDLYAVLKTEFHAVGFNVILQDGENTGQSVEHLHFHVIPRKFKDISNFKLYLLTSFKWIHRPKLNPDKQHLIAFKLRDRVKTTSTYIKPLTDVTWI